MKLTNNLYFYPEHYPEQGKNDSNTYVVTGNPNIIIDPGDAIFLPALIDGLRRDGIDPGSISIITNTHLHGDHCGANEAFKEISGAKIAIHPVQKKLYEFVIYEVARDVGQPPIEFKEDYCLDSDGLSTGDVEFELIHSPGHSPDCVCFYSREERVLVCGDVLFDRNIGRVDFLGGDADEMKKSIDRLSRLDIDYLLPGHMDIVTGAENVRYNFDFIKGNILRWL